jgi:hypothetical protein
MLLMTTAVGWGQFGVPLNHTDEKLEPAQIRELVAKYCRLDYAGARLTPTDWPKIQPTVAWKVNPDFSLFMVTSRFDVSGEVDSVHGKYEIAVQYRLLGKYDLSEGYSQDSSNNVETVRFVISEVNGEWRITEAEPNYPHPSKAATEQWISQKQKDASDPVAQTIYKQALETLQEQKSSPLAK